MGTRPNILVYTPNGSLTVAVTLQAYADTTPAWATEVRRFLLEAGAIPDAPYYVVATLDRIYLWTDARAAGPDNLPDHAIDTGCVLTSAFRGGTPVRELGRETFEAAISSWLTTLAYADFGSADGEAARWIRETGLREAMRRGSLQFADAA